MRSARVSLASLVFLSSALFAQSVPFVSQPLIPSSITPGSPSFTLIVNGAGFAPTSQVNWNGTPRTTQFVSVTQLKSTILASDVAQANTGNITVTSPGTRTSNIVPFPVTNPVPVLEVNESLLATAADPLFVATGDFNHDGNADIAASGVQGKVSILLGNGDGTFQPHVDYATAAGAFTIVTGDFNNDGNLDLAICNFGFGGDTSGEVLLGKGDGTFLPEIKFVTGSEPIGITAGDFNADGLLDLATADTGDSTVSVLLGKGNGTFQPKVSYATGTGAWRVTTADFNGDGALDLAVVNNSPGRVSVLLNNGDGTFQAAVIYGGGDSPQPIIAADYNSDGKPDIAISGTQGSTSLLLGNGDGTFQPLLVTSGGGQDIVAGEFNGDGKLDLASSSVLVLLGNADATFSSGLSFLPAGAPIGIAAADFNHDGMLDLVTADSSANNVAVLLQTTVRIAPAKLQFGVVRVGFSSATQTLTLTTSAALTISNISGSPEFQQTNNCGTSLPAGGSCTIDVSFSPTSGGLQTGTLTVTDSAPSSPQVVPLSGMGTIVSLVPHRLAFGIQKVGTNSDPKTATLTNIGEVNLNVSTIQLTGSQFTETNNCPATLAPHMSCAITVVFSPTSVGLDDAYVSVMTDGGGQQRVELQGKGSL